MPPDIQGKVITKPATALSLSQGMYFGTSEPKNKKSGTLKLQKRDCGETTQCRERSGGVSDDFSSQPFSHPS